MTNPSVSFEETTEAGFHRLLKHDLCPDKTSHGPCDRCYDVRRVQAMVKRNYHLIGDCKAAWDRRAEAHAREVAAARLAGGTETVGQIARWIVERKDGSTTSGRRNAFAKLLRYLSQVKSGISARAGGGKEEA